MIIADFDTGIDLMHPAFFFPDGDTLGWTDVNTNGIFDAGIDGIDKNENSNIDSDELLNFISAFSTPDQDIPSDFHPSLDWLFNDINNNQTRDFGAEAFQETDPAYGEPLYIAIDENQNDVLDIGEKIVALHTSKVRKVFESDGTIRTRGIDLIYNEGDYWGHVTPVCGILAGGFAGINQMTGIAPDAELLMGVNVYIDDPPFIQTMEIFAPWAANEAANIMLYALVDAALRNSQKFFRVHILPFRMTEENMVENQNSKWITFWENLKKGYDCFEKNKLPPNVSLKNGKYIFQ